MRLPPVNLPWRSHEFIPQTQVHGQPRRRAPVILPIESEGVKDVKSILICKRGLKLDQVGFAHHEMGDVGELDLPISRIIGLISFIPPIAQEPKLERVFAPGPYKVVA